MRGFRALHYGPSLTPSTLGGERRSFREADTEAHQRRKDELDALLRNQAEQASLLQTYQARLHAAKVAEAQHDADLAELRVQLAQANLRGGPRDGDPVTEDAVRLETMRTQRKTRAQTQTRTWVKTRAGARVRTGCLEIKQARARRDAHTVVIVNAASGCGARAPSRAGPARGRGEQVPRPESHQHAASGAFNVA